MKGKDGKKVVIAAVLFALAGVWMLSLKTDSTLEKIAPQQPGGPATYSVLFSGQALKVMSLGFDHAVAVYNWLKLIQYCAYCSDHSLPLNNLYNMTDTITTLDPGFDFVYQMSWVFLMNYDVRPNKIRIEEGEKILRKGWTNNTDSYRLAQDLGFHLFYYEQKYIEAANMYNAAFALRPNFPVYAKLAASLRANAGDPELALMGLKIQYDSTKDEYVRKQLKHQMVKAQAEIIAVELDKKLAQYQKDRGVCPASLQELISAGYINRIPSDGLGGTYRLNTDTCKSESTTIGRLRIFYPPDKKKG